LAQPVIHFLLLFSPIISPAITAVTAVTAVTAKVT
jgi:hypothetical protein